MILYPPTIDTIFNDIHFGLFQGVFVLCDNNTENTCYPLIKNNLPTHHLIVVPCNESSKTLETASTIWDELIKNGGNRQSLLINIGGGMITDLGAFSASVFQRGIRFYNIPTTLLAMVDASNGGKTGINFAGYKNYIGTFAQPEATIINTQWLGTLPEQELLNGWAEIVKHAIIDGKDSWEKLNAGIPKKEDVDLWVQIVKHNIDIKSKITEADPREENIRKKLNLGHTIGHGIESTMSHNANSIPHGIAVAAGLICEIHIARKMQLCSAEFAETATQYLKNIFPTLPYQFSESEFFFAAILADKKNDSGQIRMSLPCDFGQVLINCEVSPDVIKDCMKWYETV